MFNYTFNPFVIYEVITALERAHHKQEIARLTAKVDKFKSRSEYYKQLYVYEKRKNNDDKN